MEISEILKKAALLSPVSDEEYERALNKRRRGDEKGFFCEKCDNWGYTWRVLNGERFYKQCACMAKRRSMRRIEKSGLSEQLKRCTFAQFLSKNPWQEQIKQTVLRFLSPENEEKWLFLSGQSGCGKTHLCTAAAGELIACGKDVYYMRWTEESTALKALTLDEGAYRRRILPMKNCDVLYIDDFWKSQKNTPPSPADIRLAFDLLDFRYLSPEKRTIISTERTFSEILAADEAIGGRIYEKTEGFRIEIASDREKNYRLIE